MNFDTIHSAIKTNQETILYAVNNLIRSQSITKGEAVLLVTKFDLVYNTYKPTLPFYIYQCKNIHRMIREEYEKEETIYLRHFLIYMFDSFSYNMKVYVFATESDTQTTSKDEDYYNDQIIIQYINNLYTLDDNLIVYNNVNTLVKFTAKELKTFIDLLIENKLYCFKRG